MKTLDRYLLREFRAPLIYCLITFTTVFVVFDLFDRMDRFIESATPTHLIVRYYLFVLGPSLEYLAPASLMLATLYTLYVLSRHSELIAMRACGISIYRIVTPFILVGLVFSLLLLAAWETVIPHATEWSSEFRDNRFRLSAQQTWREAQYYNASGRRQWSIGRFNPRQPSVLHDVEIMLERPDGRWDRRITAGKLEWLDGQWWLTQARVQHFGDANNPVGGPTPLGFGRPPIITLPELDESPALFTAAVRPWEYLTTAQMIAYVRGHPMLSESDRAVKIHAIAARLAMPWACLIVILFAIPAGARTGRQGALAAVFTAIGMLVGFYALSQFGLILGTAGVVPPWLGAWLSNFVFLGLGIGMICKLR